jgi:hypothetical protein
MLSYQLQQQFVGWQITIQGNLSHYRLIGIVVVIVVVVAYIKKTISPKPERLMNLKIETDGLHIEIKLNPFKN